MFHFTSKKGRIFQEKCQLFCKIFARGITRTCGSRSFISNCTLDSFICKLDSTHKSNSITKFNEADLRDKINKGAAHFRSVGNHSAASTLIASPNKETRRLLYLIQKPRGSRTYIDFAIGQRVSCIRNLGTQIGES